MFYVPRATCDVRRATCHVPRATCHVPRAACDVPRAACYVPRATFAVAVVIVLSVAGCSPPRDPIIVQEGTITLENQTSSAWRDVRITVNDYFVGGGPTLEAGGRMNAPLSQFVTGFGQRFDRGRMSVRKIEVTATNAQGEPVKLDWQPGLRLQ